MKNKDLPLVSIIVLNYNGRPLLEKFLSSVVNLDYANKELIVIDNASIDGSVEFLKLHYPDIKVIVNPQNLGTAEASNIGARHSKGDFILWLSNDMEVQPSMLQHMLKHLLEDTTIGICTCKMKSITASGQKLNVIDRVGGDLDIFGFPYERGLNELDTGKWDNFSEVFFSFGGAMLIKREVFESTGGYDAATFTLADDIDLCWRARLLGYRIVVEPKALLYHQASATLGSIYGRGYKRFLSEKNTIRALLKNYTPLSLIAISPLYFLLLCGELMFFLALGKLILFKAVIKAVRQNFLELPDILRQRKIIQSRRVKSEADIFRALKKKSHKFGKFMDFLHTSGRGPYWYNYFEEKITKQIG